MRYRFKACNTAPSHNSILSEGIYETEEAKTREGSIVGFESGDTSIRRGVKWFGGGGVADGVRLSFLENDST